MRTEACARAPTQPARAPACPECGAAECSPVWPRSGEHGFMVIGCQACGLAFTAPRLAPSELASWYPSEYYGEQCVRFNRLMEWAVAQFARSRVRQLLQRPSGKVLDIGCGRGQSLEILRQAGWQVEGLELSERAAEYARNVLKLPVRLAPFDPADYPSESFDAILLWHVLEHLPDAPGALEGMVRMLRPGGVLLLAVPNLASTQAAWSRYGWFHLDLPRHVWHFRDEWLATKLQSLGCEILERRYDSLDQNAYGWIQSILNRSGLEHNLLYDVLRRNSARQHGSPWRRRPLAAALSVLGMFALAPVALALVVLDAWRQRGATVEILARRLPTTTS